MGYWVKTAFQGVASAAARRSLDLSVLLVTEYFIILLFPWKYICVGYWVKTAFQGVASTAARRSLDLSVLLYSNGVYTLLYYYFPGISGNTRVS